MMTILLMVFRQVVPPEEAALKKEVVVPLVEELVFVEQMQGVPCGSLYKQGLTAGGVLTMPIASIFEDKESFEGACIKSLPPIKPPFV